MSMRRLSQRFRLLFAIARLGATAVDSLRLLWWASLCHVQSVYKTKRMATVRVRLRIADKMYPVWLSGIVDLWVLKDIFIDCEYVLPEIPAPKTIVDVGCNVGLSTLFFATKYPTAQVYAIEPNPELAERLFYNTRTLQNVSRHTFALGDVTGKAPFYIASTATSSSLAVGDGRPVMVSVVAATDLRHFLGIERIDVLKFDIEGAERHLFAASQFFAHVGCAVGEMHYDYLECEPSAIKTPQGFSREERILKASRSILLLTQKYQTTS